MDKFEKKIKFGQPSNKGLFEKAKAKKEKANEVSKDDKKDYLKRLASDEDLQKKYAEELVPKVDLNVYAESFVSDFFNVGTVSLGEPMWYELEFDVNPKAEVSYISQHGGTPSKTYVTDGDLVRIHPYFIQTPQVHMNKLSLKQGDISNEQKMRDKLSRGMTKRMNDDMWTLLRDNLVDSGSTLEDDMQIVLDEDYKNFPDSNNIDASGEGGITLDIFKNIADYANRLDLTVNNIYAPANRIKDIYDWISVDATSGGSLVPSSVHEEVVRTGIISNLFGYNVNLVPVHTLDGTEGNSSNEIELFVSTSEPAGEVRNVRELDDVFREEDARRVYFTETKGVAMFSTPYQKKNMLRVVFDEYTG